MASLIVNYGPRNQYQVEFELQTDIHGNGERLCTRYKNPDTMWEPCKRMPENRHLLDMIEVLLQAYNKIP